MTVLAPNSRLPNPGTSLAPVTHKTLTSYLIGEESLLIQCAETWLSRGHVILGIVSNDPRIVAWASERSLPVIDPENDLTARLSGEPFDYLLSITNLRMLPGSVLGLPRLASINFHDGPLPEYAGLRRGLDQVPS